MKKFLIFLGVLLASVLLLCSCGGCKHANSEWVVDTEPTMDTEGLRHRQCTDCGKTLFTESIPVTGPMDNGSIKNYLLERTVAIVINGKILGSGFFIDEDGTIVTAFHVIDNAFTSVNGIYPGIHVKFEGATYEVANILKFDYNRDVAVLKIDLPNKKVPYLNIATDLPKVNDIIYVCGFKSGASEAKVDEGDITSLKQTWGIASAYEHNALAEGGDSGGPIVNQRGEVIAIHVGSYTGATNRKLAVKIAELDSLKHTTSMDYAEFVEWHLFESREAMRIFYRNEHGYYADDDSYLYDRSYIQTYHDKTGANCISSKGPSKTANGYNMNLPIYTYTYNKDQSQNYISYLKEEGFTYSGNTNYNDGSYSDCYYSSVLEAYIELYVYTNPQSGIRYIETTMYYETSY